MLALVILGVGALLYGLVPWFAVLVRYALVLWSFLVEIAGSSIGQPLASRHSSTVRSWPGTRYQP